MPRRRQIMEDTISYSKGADISSGSSEIHRRRLAARNEGGAAYLRRRRDLLAAAAEVFRKKGYQRATLNDIAQQVGTDRASLYYYVSGKQELFDELVRDVISNNMSYAEQVRDSSDPADVKLRNVIVALMHSCEEHYPYVYIYVQENFSQTADKEANDEALSYGQRYSDAVTAIVQEGLDAGFFSSSVPSNVLAFGIIGMVNWTHRWFKPGRSLTGRAIGEAYTDMVLAGLKSPSMVSLDAMSPKAEAHPSAEEHPAEREDVLNRVVRP
jgi:AcrR family transcriptional regulator